MKVSELEGATLDFWVAKAEGRADVLQIEEKVRRGEHMVGTGEVGCWFPGDDHSVSIEGAYYADHGWVLPYSPSTRWAQGGPIMERHHIDLSHCEPDGWMAWCSDKDDFRVEGSGPTPLIAAMRCFVGSVFGESVPEPFVKEKTAAEIMNRAFSDEYGKTLAQRIDEAKPGDAIILKSANDRRPMKNIEMRWIENGDGHEDSPITRILEYREVINPGEEPPKWSEWQEVPVTAWKDRHK